jgi:hypothetical protein
LDELDAIENEIRGLTGGEKVHSTGITTKQMGWKTLWFKSLVGRLMSLPRTAPCEHIGREVRDARGKGKQMAECI